MFDYEIVGKKLPLISSNFGAQGQLQFIDDIKINDMLFGKILRSPFPHARILSIDTSRAKALKGVKAAITAQDMPKVKFGVYPDWADRYPLALDIVRHVGEGVAAVAAVDEETAEEALHLIKVEYEPLTVYLDPVEAMQPGAQLIHENKPGNISCKVVRSYGDVERGFAESDYVREDTFKTVPNNHGCIEPHGTVTQWHQDNSLTVWSSNQGPFLMRQKLFYVLGLPEDKVRVIKTATGGAFGGKSGSLDIHYSSAFISRMTGRPVKMILAREEVFMGTYQRHPQILKVRTGIKKNGTLVSQELKAIIDGGAYTGTGTISLEMGGHQMLITYIIPNVRYEGTRVFTNKPMGAAMRGHGAPQVRFAIESQLDMIARDLNMDPVELRMKNVTYAGYDHPAKKRIGSCGLKDAIHTVVKELKWQDKKGKAADGHGFGISCSSFGCGAKPFPHAGGGIIIEINKEGGVNILSGAADVGQGIDTVISQIVAEELGVNLADTRVTAGDTAITPYDIGTYGSGVTLRVGNAAIKAAQDAKKQLLDIISLKLEAPQEKIRFRAGNIYIEGQKERAMTFKDALRAYNFTGKTMPLVGRGFYEPDCLTVQELECQEGPDTPAYSFYSQGAEVKVDRETGEIKVLKLITAVDCGQPMNPLSIEGQAQGSMVGGLGMAFFENLPTTDGRYLNNCFLDYLIPSSVDIPEDMYSKTIPTYDPYGPMGAKEAGEGMLVPLPAAIANAVHDAIGLRINDLPITPDKILSALNKQKGGL